MTEDSETRPPHPDLERHLAAFRRGAVDLIEEGELGARLNEALHAGRFLRIKLGLDPSSPDLHVGHMVQLKKLRDLQDLGHQLVLIVGAATAMVGDPSGRNKLRPQLTREQVEENLATYLEQAALVLDMERTEVRRNSEWFFEFDFEACLRLMGRMTVARMIERDTFQKRMEAGEPVGIHEFFYPLMQGWDSVEIRSDAELGGTDQLFNLLVGRHLQEQEGQPGQICFTMPLIDGLDGRKMSKSYGNAIGLTDEPRDMFGKVMSIADDAMERWFVLLTDLPEEEIAQVLAGHPREAKARLATELVTFLHDADAATDGLEAFNRQFRDKEVPDDVALHTWEGDWPDEGLPLSVVLRELELVGSSSEARRLINQGGVKLDGEPEKNPNAKLTREDFAGGERLIQVGKKRFKRLKLG